MAKAQRRLPPSSSLLASVPVPFAGYRSFLALLPRMRSKVVPSDLALDYGRYIAEDAENNRLDGRLGPTVSPLGIVGESFAQKRLFERYKHLWWVMLVLAQGLLISTTVSVVELVTAAGESRNYFAFLIWFLLSIAAQIVVTAGVLVIYHNLKLRPDAERCQEMVTTKRKRATGRQAIEGGSDEVGMRTVRSKRSNDRRQWHRSVSRDWIGEPESSTRSREIERSIIIPTTDTPLRTTTAPYMVACDGDPAASSSASLENLKPMEGVVGFVPLSPSRPTSQVVPYADGEPMWPPRVRLPIVHRPGLSETCSPQRRTPQGSAGADFSFAHTNLRLDVPKSTSIDCQSTAVRISQTNESEAVVNPGRHLEAGARLVVDSPALPTQALLPCSHISSPPTVAELPGMDNEIEYVLPIQSKFPARTSSLVSSTMQLLASRPVQIPDVATQVASSHCLTSASLTIQALVPPRIYKPLPPVPQDLACMSSIDHLSSSYGTSNFLSYRHSPLDRYCSPNIYEQRNKRIVEGPRHLRAVGRFRAAPYDNTITNIPEYWLPMQRRPSTDYINHLELVSSVNMGKQNRDTYLYNADEDILASLSRGGKAATHYNIDEEEENIRTKRNGASRKGRDHKIGVSLSFDEDGPKLRQSVSSVQSEHGQQAVYAETNNIVGEVNIAELSEQAPQSTFEWDNDEHSGGRLKEWLQGRTRARSMRMGRIYRAAGAWKFESG